MPITAHADARKVLTALVDDPALGELERLRRWEPMQVGLVGGVWALFLCSTAAALAGWIPTPVAILLNAVAIYGAFTPLHDATHRAVSSDDRINDLLGTLAGTLLLPGMTANVYRVLHLEHHRWVGDPERDPDTVLAHTRGPLVPLLLAAPDLVWLHFWLTKLWPKRNTRERTELVAAFAIYGALHVGLLLSPYAIPFLLLWVLPQRVGIMFTAYTFARIQHPEGTDWNHAPLQSTAVITTRPHRLARLALLGQNDHHIHHLLPHLPWYRYHEAWALGGSLLREQALPERGVFRDFDPIFLASVQTTRRVRVAAVRDVGRDIKAFTLEAAAAPGLPSFTAGAHITLHLPSGTVRHYSLCSDPAATGTWEIAVKREASGRGGSKEVHAALQAGAVLTAGLPCNFFELDDGVSEAVLVAGGIGVTPMLAMAHSLHRRGTPFALHICARDAAHLPFAAELAHMPFAEQVHVHLDDDPVSRFDPARDLPTPGPRHQLYMCGPGGFMDFVRTSATAQGWSSEAIRSESFGVPQADTGTDTAFDVTLKRTGQTVTVPADAPIIDALRNAGVPVRTACLQGVCGSCVVAVLEGEVDHRDAVLSADEQQDRMCVCVSRACGGSPLVLDL